MENRDFYFEVREIVEWWVSTEDCDEVRNQLNEIIDNVEELE
jgi:hypothetical protein